MFAVKRLLFIIILTFNFQSWAKAEIYSCNYKWNDEIRTTVAKRTGSSFTTIYESGEEFKYHEMIEKKDRIILIDSLDSVFMTVIWKDEKKFTMVGFNSEHSKTTEIIHGNCRVIE